MALLSTGHFKNIDIAVKCGVSKRTVQRVRKEAESGGLRNKKVGKCGRKRKTSKATDRHLQRQAIQDPFLSSYEQAAQLELDAGIKVSHMTVRRRLKELGFKSVRPEKKPRLTIKMRQKRLDWAHQHCNWTVDDWKKVLLLKIIAIR